MGQLKTSGTPADAMVPRMARCDAHGAACPAGRSTFRLRSISVAGIGNFSYFLSEF